jgi:hypothetical protein
MADPKHLEEALRLVEDLCTADQVRDLLRVHKTKDVRITAEKKEDLVRRNLREAITSNAVSISEVFDLIRDAEENGNQHIFYYRPETKKLAAALALENVARQLWGTRKESTVAGFPNLTLIPDSFSYSDLRVPGSKKPNDWLLKIYGQKAIVRATGKVEHRPGGYIWREFVAEPLRIVLSARWNAPDLLEIRIQRDESRRRIEEWQQVVWRMLSPALTRAQFSEWPVTPCMRRIVLEAHKHEKVYDFRDAGVIDETNEVIGEFQAISDQGNLFQSTLARNAVNKFVNDGGELKALAVRWKTSESSNVPSRELRTLLGVKETHEVLIASHCSALDVEYVTDQLRGFSK